MADQNNQNPNSEYEKLKESKFKQQKLPAWRPVPSICCTILIFLAFGLAFIIIGVIVLIFSNEIYETTLNYSEKCKGTNPCTYNFYINEDLTNKTVMFYYQLTNFYQNHRRYVKSKSNSQLLGNWRTADQVKSDCDPVIYNKDLGIKNLQNYQKTKALNPEEVAMPCGLIAKSFFNDTYTLNHIDNEGKLIKNYEINQKKIAWPADLSLKYKLPSDEKIREKMWMNTENEHFVVWMRPAGLPDFRKLWGRIDDGLKKGNYSLVIDNNYPTQIFSGTKSVVLSTVNAFGGKNTFLGISYLVVGGICIFMAIGFGIGDKIQKNKTN